MESEYHKTIRNELSDSIYTSLRDIFDASPPIFVLKELNSVLSNFRDNVLGKHPVGDTSTDRRYDFAYISTQLDELIDELKELRTFANNRAIFTPTPRAQD